MSNSSSAATGLSAFHSKTAYNQFEGHAKRLTSNDLH